LVVNGLKNQPGHKKEEGYNEESNKENNLHYLNNRNTKKHQDLTEEEVFSELSGYFLPKKKNPILEDKVENKKINAASAPHSNKMIGQD
jgi:hypothetical protein